jgi:hypothetical protein
MTSGIDERKASATIGLILSVSGSHHATKKLTGVFAGIVKGLAAGPSAAGMTIDAIVNAATIVSEILRGGIRTGRATRDT